MEQRSGSELRADGNTIFGIAVRYELPSYVREIRRREQILALAFVPIGTVILDLEHRTAENPLAFTPDTLQVSDTTDALRFRAQLNSDAGKAVYADVASGKLTGCSVSFVAHEEHSDIFQNLRTISAATLHRIALTANPAHDSTAIEARSLRIEEREGGLMLAGTLPHGPNSRIVTADRGRVRKAEYGRSTWEHTVNSELGKLAEVSLTLHRDITQQISSRRLGSLRLNNDARGLHFEADLAARGENQLHDSLRESIETSTTDWQIYPVVQIPPILRVPRPFTDIPEGPDNPGVFVRKFLHVSLRQISLVAKSGSPASKIRLVK